MCPLRVFYLKDEWTKEDLQKEDIFLCECKRKKCLLTYLEEQHVVNVINHFTVQVCFFVQYFEYLGNLTGQSVSASSIKERYLLVGIKVEIF